MPEETLAGDEPMVPQHTPQQQEFVDHQQALLDKLREAAAKNPAHAEYLKALLAVPDPEGTDLRDVPRPSKVSKKAAECLIDDVYWCTMSPPPDGHFVSPYPRAYQNYLLASARRARSRKLAREANGPKVLSDLLQL
jgi:hypothetical protein